MAGLIFSQVYHKIILNLSQIYPKIFHKLAQSQLHPKFILSRKFVRLSLCPKIFWKSVPWFLRHTTGFNCTREWCSRLRWRCGSVLMAQFPVTRLPLRTLVFPLPGLQVVSISGQPQRAYCKFLELEPWSSSGASLSWGLSCIPWSDDETTNRSDTYCYTPPSLHCCDSSAEFKTSDLLSNLPNISDGSHTTVQP